jgi:hypothetical protein
MLGLLFMASRTNPVDRLQFTVCSQRTDWNAEHMRLRRTTEDENG